MNDLDVQLTPKTWTLMDESTTARSETPKSSGVSVNQIKQSSASLDDDSSTEKVDSVAAQEVPEIKLPKTKKTEEPRPVSRHMNERYPIIDTGRKTSESGFKALKRKVSQTGLEAIRRISYSRKVSKESAASKESRKASDSLVEVEQHDVSGKTGDRRPSVTKKITPVTSSNIRRPSTPIREIASPELDRTGDNASLAVPTVRPRQEPGLKNDKAKSAYDLRARYKPSRLNLRDTSINICRKPAETTTTLGRQMEDATLRKISAGPYAADCSTTLTLPERRPSPVAKENASPTLSTIGVAIGSPSWMKGNQCTACTPTSAEKEHPRYVSSRASIRAVQSSRELRREGANSPMVYSSVNRKPVGKGSPGQRMVDDFMRRKREGESPGSSSAGAGAFL
ncbi:hypothetical protein MBLNU457_7647t3 [Dothideomycetes sp. NU457]